MKINELVPLPTPTAKTEDYEMKYKGWKITAWCRETNAFSDEKKLYAQSGGNQMCFVRDNIVERMFDDGFVVSTHWSKSVELPVYCMKIGEVTLILRGNFYNYILTVDSPVDLDCIPEDLFTVDEEDVSHVYCEGFDREWVYPSYKKSRSKFTISLPYANEVLFLIAYLIKKQIKAA